LVDDRRQLGFTLTAPKQLSLGARMSDRRTGQGISYVEAGQTARSIGATPSVPV